LRCWKMSLPTSLAVAYLCTGRPNIEKKYNAMRDISLCKTYLLLRSLSSVLPVWDWGSVPSSYGNKTMSWPPSLHYLRWERHDVFPTL
jgi:hypothetical protein